jgi:2-polyprenyl-3-methyl-5-hydroxy-6-metoxy-1,4-benzoquinol methylase
MVQRTSARQVRTAVLFDISHIRLVSRIDYIVNACRGKRVVDVGCVSQGRTFVATKDPDWLHGQIVDVAQRVVGLDADTEGVSVLRTQGYDCVEGDAESLDSIDFLKLLDGKVDLIVAGEVMEHLSNPGRFLDSCKRLLRIQGGSESKLIVSVPSPYWYREMLAVMSGKEFTSSDHNYWYSPSTLSTLLGKHDFQIQSMVGYSYGSSNRIRNFRHRVIGAVAIPIVSVLLHLARTEACAYASEEGGKTPNLLWAEGIVCTASVKSNSN